MRALSLPLSLSLTSVSLSLSSLVCRRVPWTARPWQGGFLRLQRKTNYRTDGYILQDMRFWLWHSALDFAMSTFLCLAALSGSSRTGKYFVKQKLTRAYRISDNSCNLLAMLLIRRNIVDVDSGLRCSEEMDSELAKVLGS